VITQLTRSKQKHDLKQAASIGKKSGIGSATATATIPNGKPEPRHSRDADNLEILEQLIKWSVQTK